MAEGNRERSRGVHHGMSHRCFPLWPVTLFGAALLGMGLSALVGCGKAEPSAPVPLAATWQEPARYEYTVDSRCGERLLIGRLTLTIADGKVTRAAGHDESGTRIAGSTPMASLPTLKQLLDEYDTARREGAHKADVTWDPADGHPTRIDIDLIRDAIDDEACYQISGYRVLSSS